MRVPTLLCLTLLLAACGQAGDLYLPEQKPAEQQAPAPTAPATTPEEPKKDAK